MVNTTLSAKAVKVRFLEGKNSKEVLDFNLFLSKNDVWTAAVISHGHRRRREVDRQVLHPAEPVPPSGGQPFVNFAYSGDGAGDSLDRTREGYVEIIEMATFNATSTTAVNITHVSGTPKSCANNSDAQAVEGCAAGQRRPDGHDDDLQRDRGLGLLAGRDGARQLQQGRRDLLQRRIGFAEPQQRQSADQRRGRPANGNAVVTTWPAPASQPVDAVSAVLTHDAVMNEYVTDPSILAGTDWVVTMPTKNFYVAVGTGAAISPFQRNFNGTAGACDDVSLTTWDREEQTTVTPGRILAAAASRKGKLAVLGSERDQLPVERTPHPGTIRVVAADSRFEQ